jgi:hypothetical protein
LIGSGINKQSRTSINNNPPPDVPSDVTRVREVPWPGPPRPGADPPSTMELEAHMSKSKPSMLLKKAQARRYNKIK